MRLNKFISSTGLYSRRKADELIKDRRVSVNGETGIIGQDVNENDKVLIIDDFLANGEAALGAIRLVEEAGAKVVSLGIVIEKSFQPGRDLLNKKGYDVYSLARIKSLDNNRIEFLE